MKDDLGIQTLIEDLRKGGDDRFLEIERVSKNLLIAVRRLRSPHIAGVTYKTHTYLFKFLTQFETVAEVECDPAGVIVYFHLVKSGNQSTPQLNRLATVLKYIKTKNLTKKCKQWDKKFKAKGYHWVELEFYSPPIVL